MNQSLGTSTKAAIHYLRLGLTPIPLIGKRPLIKNWPTRFLSRPMTEMDILKGIEVDGNRVSYSNKNIGLLTGSISNLIVIDIDDLSVVDRLRQYGTFPDTWISKTYRAYHLYFNYDPRIRSMKLWDSVDVLANKKMVVAPPSIHPSGIEYRWIKSPMKYIKADLPEWLIDLLLNQKNKPEKEKQIAKNASIDQVYTKNKKDKSTDYTHILSKVDWLDFYTRFTSNIRGTGEWKSCQCPFHRDDHNSFSFNVNHGGWVCFAEQSSGNGFSAIQKLYGVSFKEAIKLAKGETVYV